MARACPQCARPYSHCSCLPDALREVGCERAVKLSSYRAVGRDVTERLVLRLKDVNDRALFDYLAAELTLPAFRALQDSGASLDGTVVCYAPRRRSATLAIGHDQAAGLARALSRRLGCPCLNVLCRKGSGKQQKDLSAAERLGVASKSYRLSKNACVSGKSVLLVDDICTTGATLGACAALLYEAGARAVIPVFVAMSEREQGEPCSEQS